MKQKNTDNMFMYIQKRKKNRKQSNDNNKNKNKIFIFEYISFWIGGNTAPPQPVWIHPQGHRTQLSRAGSAHMEYQTNNTKTRNLLMIIKCGKNLIYFNIKEINK